MTTSGTINFTRTRDEIVKAGLRKLGVGRLGRAPSAEEMAAGAECLNLLVKELMADGIGLWLRQEITLFLASGTESYTFPTNAATSYTETQIATAAVETDTTITVDSDTGISDGDFIGVKLDDGTIQWTTVSGAPASDVITLADALTDDVAVDNNVYAFTTKASRPQKILYAYRRDTSGVDTPVDVISREEYSRLSDKDASGQVTQVHYEPSLSGRLYVWPATDTEIDKLILIVNRTVEDFDTTTDNADFPIEWYNVLVWGVANELASERGLDPRDHSRISAMYENKKDRLLDYDTGTASVTFQFNAR